MIIKSNKVVFIFLICFLFSCEYERIAGPDNNCQPDLLELTIENVENTSCNQSTGEIEVTVAGNSRYEYKINDGDFSSTSIFSGLAAGTYRIQARDAESSCVGQEIVATVQNADGVQLSLVEKNDSDCGQNTGSIVISQVGGVEPIQYILNGRAPQTDLQFTDLASGTYDILARDAQGCEAEISGIDITSGISFSQEIKSIIATNCAVSGCHSGGQPPNFSTDENIIQNASRIKSRTASATMPPAGRPDLTEEEIQAITCWVDDGALDN